MPSKDSIRKFAVRVVVDIALNGAILVALIIIRPVLRQLAGQFSISVEPQLPSFLPPNIGSPQCPESGSRSSSSLQIGSFVYALIFVGISTSRDEMKQVQAILGIIIKAGLFLASEVVREYVGRSLCMAAYSVKTLRARLEAISRYLGFPACLGETTCLFSSMINQLKIAITCLFFFGLGVVVTMAYHHFQSLSTYAHVASGGLSLLASDLTDRAETLFVTITKSNSVLATVLFSLGLRFLVRSILSSFTLISSQNKETQKLGLNAVLLANDEEKQDSTILFEDRSFAESDKDTLCDDEVLNLNLDDDGEDESEKNISSLGREAVFIPTPIANGNKEDGPKQRREVSIIGNPTEEHSVLIPSFCASPRSISLRRQQADKLNSGSQYTPSLSAFSPEFVPRFRNTTAVNDAVQDYHPPHWALASPVSVRITAPVNRHRIRRGVCLQSNMENEGV